MGLFKPTTIDKECDKAARILKGFVGTLPCHLSSQHLADHVADKGKIPQDVIANAKGIAIFSGFRAAMYLAGNGGSGVVSARLADGSWSPPSAFSVRTGGVGLAYGVDVYDCICVLNTQAAVDAYMKSEVQLGAAVSLAAGPIGGDWTMAEVKPVWTYTKSRGIYGGLTVDGTVIKERKDANAEFYHSKVTAEQILTGAVGEGKWPAGGERLSELLKASEGHIANGKVLADITNEPTPGDLKE